MSDQQPPSSLRPGTTDPQPGPTDLQRGGSDPQPGPTDLQRGGSDPQPGPRHLERGLTSIVLIAHNGITWTRRAVAAILAHTGPPYELLLVDNGSTDGTGAYFRELAGQYAHVRAILKDRNWGGYARSFGMEEARGEFIAWVDNDAEVGQGWLEPLLGTLQDPAVGAAGAEGVAYRPDWGHLFHTKGWPPERAAGRRVDVLVGYCLLMRNLVRYIGFLDPAFYPAWNEEADYCLRIKLLGYCPVVTPAPVVHHEHRTGFPGVTDVRAHIGRMNQVLIDKWDPFKHLVLEVYRAEEPPSERVGRGEEPSLD